MDEIAPYQNNGVVRLLSLQRTNYHAHGIRSGRESGGAPYRTETLRNSVPDGVGAIYLHSLKLQIIHSFISCIILQFNRI